MNDIFYFVIQTFIYKYADDNTVSFIHKDLHNLIKRLRTRKYESYQIV